MRRLLLFTLLLLIVTSSYAIDKMTSYSGQIIGYKLSMGFRTGTIYVSNVVTGLTDTHMISIDSLGHYLVSFPLKYDRECYVKFPFSAGNIYFKNGGKLIQDFDISVIPVVKTTFKGDKARLNTELYSMRPFFSEIDWDRINKDIYQMSPEGYKGYFLAIQARKLKSIDSVSKAGNYSILSKDLASLSIRFTIGYKLLLYDDAIDISYKKANNIPYDKRTPIQPTSRREDYYDFLKDLRYNSRDNWQSGAYVPFFTWFSNMELIKNRFGRLDGVLFDYNKFLAEQPRLLKEITGTHVSLEVDLIKLRAVCSAMQNTQTPLADSTLSSLRAKLNNPSLISEVIDLNNTIKKAILDSRMKTGYANNETPKVAADSVFNNIVKKYKGKVVLVDFWATWCVPCMEGIRSISPIKEELKDENIVFLYITNHTTPEEAYRVKMPGIKGEHYKVSEQEYNVIANRFSINGIPHYMVIDKSGNVIANSYQWGDPEQVKTVLLSLAKGQ